MKRRNNCESLQAVICRPKNGIHAMGLYVPLQYAGKTRKEVMNMTNSVIPRMWTIAQVVEYLKEQDPNTRITDYRIRLWCKHGRIPYVCTGRGTRLINVDRLGEYIERIADEDNKRLIAELEQAEGPAPVRIVE